MALRGFRNIPRNLSEWGQWFSAQKNINSEPTDGNYQVVNLYYDLTNDELKIVYLDENGEEVTT